MNPSGSVEDGDQAGVYSQVYDAGGNRVGDEEQVNNTFAGAQLDSCVTAMTDGGYLVTWASNGQDGDGFGIYTRRYDAWGISVGREQRVNLVTAGDQTAPSVTGLSDGGYIVTWQSNNQDGSGYGIYARQFNDSGTAVGGEQLINTTTLGSQVTPRITELADGGYVITWEGDISEASDGSEEEIFSQAFHSDGTRAGGQMAVNTHTSYTQSAPAVAALQDGGYVVTWESLFQDGDGYGIYSRRFDSSGQPSSGEVQVNTDWPSEQTAPAVAGLSDGGYVVVWASNYSLSDPGPSIHAQRYDASGHTIGSENLVQTSVSFSQNGPSVSALADGGYVVSWTSYGQDGDADGIYFKTFSAAGTDLSGSQRLYGTAGNDTLDGGAGPDQMYGGGGNDTYVVDNIGDRAHEDANNQDTGGIDLVKASVTFTLAVFVENLTLTGTSAINGTGNGFDNVIMGNAAGNILKGLAGTDTLNGGAGADTMYGGAGNDLYIVDNAGDVASEQSTGAGVDDGGVDKVNSSVTYTLGAYIENLTLTGSAAVSGTGNALANSLLGNTGANILKGLDGNDLLNGGTGADTMYGGAGDDTYYVDNSGDVVREDTVSGIDDGGRDRVSSSISYTLGNFVENLTVSGTAAINATGNALNNSLVGNSAANVLTGLAGNDVLTGGGGADSFVFSHFGTANGFDHVGDFASGVDHLVFKGSDYGFAANHVLQAGEFTLGATAVGNSAQFVFNTTTHTLYWDSNGTTAGGMTSILVMDNGATPTAGDFVFS